MNPQSAQRLLIIGWDAADWILIDRLFSAGKLPTLRRLVDAGARADLNTLEPKLSPLLWTSIATGKTADKHGILNFVEPKPEGGGLRLSSSTSRKTKALWNILSQSGLATNVVGWYASHPAEPIRGSITTNMLQEGEPADPANPWPLLAGTTHPVDRADSVAAARQRAATFPRDTLTALLPKWHEIGTGDARVRTLVKLMSYATSIERAAIVALSSGQPWDATMIFFDAIDAVGHHFMQFVAPKMAHVSPREQRLFGEVMDRVYEWHDASLARLLAAAGADTTVILVSDHGFHSDHLRPNLSDLPPERRMELESSWHRPHGVLVMSGKGVKRGATIASPTILDIAPTSLALLGIPIGEDFDGRILSEALTNPQSEIARIPSWDSVEGDAGLHPADLRHDPFDAADALQQLVDLGYMAALPADVQGQVDLVRRESAFNLGVALMSRRRANEAIPSFAQLVSLRPSEVRYTLCLGNCLLAAGRFEDAAACAKALLDHAPSNLEVQMLRAVALHVAGEVTLARDALARIECAAAGRAEMTLALGKLMDAFGRHEDALCHYEAAKKHNPRDPAVHAGLASAHVALGHFEIAVEHALDALELSQALPYAHLTLGAALAWCGDFANATTSLEFALRHDPGLADALRFLAVVHELTATNAATPDAAARARTAADDARARARALLATVVTHPRDAPHGPTDFARKHGVHDV
ncbi:MAG: tetratricopeptide repeat protein [Phycisphaerales bacterium]|nr:tetratricopeptide repeat protein [Phycisphaerales bacterium]